MKTVEISGNIGKKKKEYNYKGLLQKMIRDLVQSTMLKMMEADLEIRQGGMQEGCC